MGGIVLKPCIILLIVQAAVKNTWSELQHLPEVCEPSRTDDHECPELYDEREFLRLTEDCCGSHPNTSFHCQEHKTVNDEPYIVVACLPVVTPPPGNFVFLFQIKYPHQPLLNVTMELRPCTPELYEPRPKASYMYRYPWCSETKQTCSITYGKIDIFPGNTSHDRTCLCDWLNGWMPVNNTTQACIDPAGFHFTENCHCHKYTCPHGQRLNQNYTCIMDVNSGYSVDPSTSFRPSTPKSNPPASSSSKPSGAHSVHFPNTGFFMILILISTFCFTATIHKVFHLIRYV